MINKNVHESVKLIVSITICLFAGFLGSFFTIPAIPTWYATLTKPSFAPPNWLFFPVWTTLFVMMGISLYLVWRRGLEGQQVKNALVIFAVQLILNVLWSAAFFGLRSPLSGLIEISILWISIAFTIMIFMKISRTAGLLLIPYIIWVSFAAILNFMIWRLNS
ncbi:Tryptophan-rich protein TspO [Methanosarcinales archaeon]|nr:TspO/MBR family protein [Candidatus Methanoperedens sp. BLZ2]KAB2947309.1 MAG: tryptophan-rich sensory protein [Candidatus Methanoperedens sp.]MBZ0175549.1 tryptophan-rich sensory protein [Candidatus Methanoperedens nitroreducens]CAG0957263.1 Tryptophan-rich protein TspO [Methanosarcinales archaeon]MCX9080281.1 tryptophan-rich sensory protein [Candidatus Methanoperedens sp.]MCX9089265.1 tryptophan-rich sensory protein [Candidatus Methanoperedens sp.]